MEQEIELQQDQTGQIQRLMKRYLQSLRSNPEHRITFDFITNQTNKIFERLTWYSSTLPFTIDEINQELEDVEVDTALRKPGENIHTILNAGRVSRKDIHNGDQRRIFKRDDNKTGE